MSFRLHTHFCVNNSFSFSKSLRKQVGKSEEVWAERRALGSLHWDPAWHQEPQSPQESRAGPGGSGDTFSTIQGFSETPAFARQEDAPFTEQTWPLMSDQKFDSYPKWDWNQHLNAYHPKGHLLLKYAHLCVRQFLPPLGIIFKNPWN